MPLGTTSGSQELWADALIKADGIQELMGLDEEVPLDFWTGLDDDLAFLWEENEGRIDSIELHLLTTLIEDTGILLEAKRNRHSLPEADRGHWHWTVNVALAINNNLLARKAMHQLRRDKPEQLAQLLESIGISEQELPALVFEMPEGIGEPQPMTEADRQAFIARIYDDPNSYR